MGIQAGLRCPSSLTKAGSGPPDLSLDEGCTVPNASSASVPTSQRCAEGSEGLELADEGRR